MNTVRISVNSSRKSSFEAYSTYFKILPEFPDYQPEGDTELLKIIKISNFMKIQKKSK